MAPVVVQGTAVSPPQATAVSYGDNEATAATATAVTEHEPSKTGCKDPIFAVLFYVNIIAIVVVCVLYGKDALSSSTSFDYGQVVAASLVFGVASLVFSGGGLLFLLQYPSFMIKAGLIFSVVIALAWTVYAFMLQQWIMGAIGALFFLLTLCYVRAVWSRIPFAVVNMVTAATAIKANLGVTIFAIFFSILQVGWLVVWTIAFVGVYESTTANCDVNSGACNMNYGFLFLLFLSLFFTQQVLQACVHVTVAGTVGTWWVAPEESGCCSRGVCNAFIRTVTTSFGSICFGSLLVAILQALRALASSARSNGDGNFLACIAECILGCLASILEYFNKWAYIYVGIYGYSYFQSGKAVMQLFADRGWDAVIADDLVGNAILLTSIVSGLFIGAVGVGYASANAGFQELAGGNLWVAFVIGLLAGLCICSILLSTVASGVNTVIVMFADAPREFQANHPELSQKMTSTWNQFYPGSVQ